MDDKVLEHQIRMTTSKGMFKEWWYRVANSLVLLVLCTGQCIDSSMISQSQQQTRHSYRGIMMRWV